MSAVVYKCRYQAAPMYFRSDSSIVEFYAGSWNCLSCSWRTWHGQGVRVPCVGEEPGRSWWAESAVQVRRHQTQSRSVQSSFTRTRCVL